MLVLGICEKENSFLSFELKGKLPFVALSFIKKDECPNFYLDLNVLVFFT